MHATTRPTSRVGSTRTRTRTPRLAGRFLPLNLALAARLRASHLAVAARLRASHLAVAAGIAMATIAAAALPAPASAQRFSLEDVLSAPFAYELVAARTVDRIAWLENEAGMRNVYTAAAPNFTPVRLTSFMEDDGTDLTGLQISDDGTIVTFIRGHAPNRSGWVANPMSDPAGAERAVWAVSTGGGEPWRIVAARSYDLAPDGDWLLYMDDGQLHRAPVNPGLDAVLPADELPPLFRVYGDTEDPVWSPDGRRIAFVSDRGTHSYIGVYDIGARRVTYMAPSVDHDASPAWSPDGRRLAFVRRPGATYGDLRTRPDTVHPDSLPAGFVDARFRGGHGLEVWVADAASGEGRRLWNPSPEDSTFARMAGLTWADESLVFWEEPDDWRRYYSLSTTDPERPEPLSHEEGLPEQIGFSADGRYFYFASNHGDIDRRHIWRVRTDGGDPEPVTRGGDIETFPAPLASGRQIALLSAGARQTQSVAVVDADGGDVRVVSRVPASFPAAQHVVPENVVLTSPDGLTFHNQLFLPPDLRPGERRPALIFTHGGPRRQMLLGYQYRHFYHMAYAVNQYFANKGYIVLSVNYRGGIGYGKEFRTAPDMGRRGSAEYQDVRTAGEYLRDRADVDADRIGLWGLSYGGILTAQGLARDSDLFAAGVDIAGVHFWGDLEPGSTMWDASSAPLVEQWTSPVLLVHGDDDRNVSFSQTVGLVQLLRANDVPFELMVFPDEVHSFLVHDRWLRTFQAADDFFDRTMIRGEGVRVE
ncbi:MAG TPA: prolyl oligopeptidase family serine peptidase [Longimicrobiales bacterium]|nr:prolyl oligopeptidase family serine peptidase [Longimicrobiales bacterium]